jgi:ElaB/YqjD/DUF883 family membrane-anchored ribosome-binding protein
MNDMTLDQKDKLMADLRVVIADAEDLLRLGAEQTGASAIEWRARVEVRLAQAKAKLVTLQETAVEKALAAGHAADDFVHDSPWKAVGAAAGIGLVIGLLIGRR